MKRVWQFVVVTRWWRTAWVDGKMGGEVSAVVTGKGGERTHLGDRHPVEGRCASS